LRTRYRGPCAQEGVLRKNFSGRSAQEGVLRNDAQEGLARKAC
jgi:hypothetical protein